jgi:CheY-like chemotaxis protein
MKRIAIVEDNPDNRLLLRVLLRENYDLQEYETGAAALAGLVRQPPHLVLMDLSLPDMDGAELLGRMRALEPLRGLPVVAVTAQAMAGSREQILALGFAGYVSKPLMDFEAFLALLDRVLGEARPA